jgi:hypothetical protein
MSLAEQDAPGRGAHHSKAPASVNEDETPAERLDREHEQLFQELRAVIPGAEVLFAFLLTVAFTNRFQSITTLQRSVYFFTFICAGLSLVSLLAPAAFHRVRFRRRDKEAMMRAANREAIAALVLVGLSIGGTVFLVTDVVLGLGYALVTAPALWLTTAILWWGYPLSRRRTAEPDSNGRTSSTGRPSITAGPSGYENRAVRACTSPEEHP